MSDITISDCIMSQKRKKRIHQRERYHIFDYQIIVLHQNDNIHEIGQEK